MEETVTQNDNIASVKVLLQSDDVNLLLERQMEYALEANKILKEAQMSFFESEQTEADMFEKAKAEGLSDERAKHAMKSSEERLLMKSKMLEEEEKAKNNQLYADLIAAKLRFLQK